MSPEETSLAAQVAALPRFAWAPGMVGIDKDGARWLVYLGHPPILCGQGIGHAGYVGGWESSAPIFLSPVPDLADAGTAGILLGMLPPVPWSLTVADGRYTIDVYTEGEGGHPGDPRNNTSGSGESLGVAVARALVAIGRCAA